MTSVNDSRMPCPMARTPLKLATLQCDGPSMASHVFSLEWRLASCT